MGALGLVFASHGTTDGQAYRRDILPVVEALRSFATARGLPFAPACVSARVREGLCAQKIKVPGVREAVAQLTGEGAGKVLVMPSHLVGGSTYQVLEDEAAALGVPAAVSVSDPLLSTRSGALELVRAVLGEHPARRRCKLLLVAHGVAGCPNDPYVWLREAAAECGRADVMVVTLGDDPREVAARLASKGATRVTLVPLMLCAGHHVRLQVASRAPGSWAGALVTQGLAVDVVREGLGSIQAVRDCYVKRARIALDGAASPL